MSGHQPKDPDFAGRAARSFGKQGLMETIGARILRVAPGEVDIELPVTPRVTQQHGFVHAGAVSAIADSACGFAALTLMAPAAGERLVAEGRVVKAGRLLTVAQAEVFAEAAGSRRLVALLTATLVAVEGRDGISD